MEMGEWESVGWEILIGWETVEREKMSQLEEDTCAGDGRVGEKSESERR